MLNSCGYALRLAVTRTHWVGAGVNDILLPKGPPFSLGVLPHQLLGLPCPPPEERHLSMPEIGEKELFI